MEKIKKQHSKDMCSQIKVYLVGKQQNTRGWWLPDFGVYLKSLYSWMYNLPNLLQLIF